MNAVLIVLFAWLVQDSEVRPADPTSRTEITAPSEKPAPPELVETEPKRVAYFEHLGPYWSLGPVIDRVARDAKAMGIRDALVIRYLDDPVAAAAQGLRTHVGFELAGTELPPSPYQVAQWQGVLAARKTVNGPDGLSTRHFASLKAWANTQGLAPAGDLIALVQLGEGGESGSIEHAELFIPVCVPDPLPTPTSIQESMDKVNRAYAAEAEVLSSGQRRISKVIQLPVTADVTPQESPRPDLGSPVQAPSGTRPVAPSDERPARLPVAPARPIAPIRQWIDEGKFAEVAAAILPENPDLASHQWADQMAARIIAIDNGVHSLSPGEEGWLEPLAAQLHARRTAHKSSSAKGAPRVIGLTPPSTAKEAQRKVVLRDMDYLMAKIAQRTLTPAQVRESLTKLLEETEPLVFP